MMHQTVIPAYKLTRRSIQLIAKLPECLQQSARELADDHFAIRIYRKSDGRWCLSRAPHDCRRWYPDGPRWSGGPWREHFYLWTKKT